MVETNDEACVLRDMVGFCSALTTAFQGYKLYVATTSDFQRT